MFTPLDLKNKTFTKGFRGYETEEVDKFFAQVVKDFERLYQDNIELKETVERVSAKLEYYQQMEATMQNTLVVAQETAPVLPQPRLRPKPTVMPKKCATKPMPKRINCATIQKPK